MEGPTENNPLENKRQNELEANFEELERRYKNLGNTEIQRLGTLISKIIKGDKYKSMAIGLILTTGAAQALLAVHGHIEGHEFAETFMHVLKHAIFTSLGTGFAAQEAAKVLSKAEQNENPYE